VKRQKEEKATAVVVEESLLEKVIENTQRKMPLLDKIIEKPKKKKRKKPKQLAGYTLLPAKKRYVRVSTDWVKGSYGFHSPVLLSDDDGKTWQGYQEIKFTGPAETVATETKERVEVLYGCSVSYTDKMNRSVRLCTSAAVYVR